MGPPGDTRAYDARTGELVWNFHTVARPGEVGHDTLAGQRLEGPLRHERLGLVHDRRRTDAASLYMPIGGPSANYYGGDRPGANLFANSVVAVDAETGKYKWYFQTIHHDLWDSDLPPARA